jgi:glutathione S-transferase
VSGQHFTPVLADGNRVVYETWDIACYLEGRFSDRPSLFGGDTGCGMARLSMRGLNRSLDRPCGG